MGLRFRALAGVLAVLLLGLSPAASAAELKVQVEGLRTRVGVVRLGLYRDPARFPRADGTVAGASVKVDGGAVVYVFHDLAPGTYAVSLYHDENGNNKFDSTWIGLPEEGYGFSNGATAILSAPSFDEAAITVGEPETDITIKVTYW